ncbi:MAG: iron-containing alcohol dehydrogenase [Armatimonadota bacterium]
MMEFSYYNSVQLTFGEGTFSQIGTLTEPWGEKAMLVTGRSAMEKAGYLQKAQELLSEAGLEVVTFNEIPPNPDLATVRQGADLASAQKCDVIVGLGGGSAMDSAKAIAVGASHDRPLTDFLVPDENGEKTKPTEATLPVIAATSTAGTSSELTPFAVITISESYEKTAMAGDAIYPKAAIEDPEITYSLPPEITAATGADVLAHALEAYISTDANPMSDHQALKAIELVRKHLPDAVKNGDDEEARGGMMLANMFAGYALAACGATVMHGLEHPMSGRIPQIAHGAGLAALMPAWADMLWKRMPDRFAEIARRLGVQVGGDTREAAEKVSGELKRLLGRINLDIPLRKLEISEDMLGQLADDAMRYMKHGIAKTPGDFGYKDLMEMLRRSW